MTSAPQSPADAVETAVSRYGRVGVLVDDMPRAATQLAVELYATIVLPRWWVVVGNVADGVAALSKINELQSRSEDGLPFVVVVDRRLPLQENARPVDWWIDKDSIIAADFRRLTTTLRSSGLMVWISALPTLSTTAGTGRGEPSWQSRADSPVHQAVRGQNTPLTTTLLDYGPRPAVRQKWADDLMDLGREFANSEVDVILLSGAGMSRRESDTDAGMLDNEGLMRAAALWALQRRKEGSRNVDAFAFEHALRNDKSAFAEWVRAIRHEVAGDVNGRATIPRAPQRLSFNQMWSPLPKSAHQQIRDLRSDIELGLRVVVTANDRGITHQHYLAAQLPFKLIVTTNFDGQHERAAVLAAAQDEANAPTYISRGLATELADGSRFKPEASATPGRLLRLYGSIASGEPLTLDPTEFEKQLKRAKPIRNVLGPTKVLVIVGHSLDDPNLVDWLSGLDLTKVVYVAIGAEERKPKLPKARKAPTILDCRAIDFFYDLFRVV